MKDNNKFAVKASSLIMEDYWFIDLSILWVSQSITENIISILIILSIVQIDYIASFASHNALIISSKSVHSFLFIYLKISYP